MTFSFLGALAVIGVFTVVVVVHELGHFLVCKWLGVRVEKFAIGFGKEIFGFDWKGTRWSICILPLGGYVKPAGEEMDETTGAPDEFFSQSWLGRFGIAVAGPVMNYLLAFLCFFWILFYWGLPQPSMEPVIGELKTGFPAQAAGLLEGDRILAINGKQIATWEEAAKLIHSQPEKTIDIRVQRTAEGVNVEKLIALVPKMDPQTGVGRIGIAQTVEIKPVSFWESLVGAKTQIWFWTELTLKYLRDMVKQRKSPELAGPVGIAGIVAKVASEGFQELLGLIALLSLNLGLFNFFPIPLLDGGHMFFYLIEGVFRRPLNKKALRVAHIIGATFLIAIFLYATTQDITRIRTELLK